MDYHMDMPRFYTLINLIIRADLSKENLTLDRMTNPKVFIFIRMGRFIRGTLSDQSSRAKAN